MAPLHPAEGERNAIVGYDGQYRVSASLILEGLLNAQLDWVRIADPEAGQVDDLQIGSQGRVDAYQVKWSVKGGAMKDHRGGEKLYHLAPLFSINVRANC